MSVEQLGIAILWLFLFGYLVVASIDFGAGFFSYYSHLTGQRGQIRTIIERYLNPVWEVTNVFLVFFFVGLVGFFPDTAYYYGTALLVPGSIAIILIAIRGSYYAFHSYGFRSKSLYMFLYGASGLLIPASLSTVLTISEGGFIAIDNGQVQFLFWELLTSPYAWAVVVLAIVSVLYISAMFLSYYASKAKDSSAFEQLRRYGLVWCLPTIFSSLFVFYAIRSHNPEHFSGMLSLWWMFALSFVCFAGATWLLWKRKHLGLSFVLVILQFGFAFFGYGASRLPYLLYPYLTITDHFTSKPMATALVIAFVLGFILLIPSLYLLMRLFLFDARYVEGQTLKNKSME
ncbi:cytochrome D ubiquinol oxidase subunit II [Brevibacillus parabrevis]|uniref:cytochrome d ubiquinol oxidase subunit II n=1 Tax=Brevibacillus parabrevis TaxID=54914 RepID=UPI0007ABA2EE|nr:cytochrome d ubiquinol oxidase subunit II [Brevibacillus parabrevis]KZE47754.1 cytochrome D ubiquinol oxidase subunit II [Brevibacillus parabrevis]